MSIVAFAGLSQFMWGLLAEDAHGSENISNDQAQQLAMKHAHRFIGTWSMYEGDKGTYETSIEITELRLPSGNRALRGTLTQINTMDDERQTEQRCQGAPTYSAGLHTLILFKQTNPARLVRPAAKRASGSASEAPPKSAGKGKRPSNTILEPCITLRIYKGSCFMDDMPTECP